MTPALLWLGGLLARRPGRLLGTGAGVACTVALLAALGAFLASSAAAMTTRAIAEVPVDWQIQLVPGSDPAQVVAALGQASSYTALEQVGYADTAGFTAGNAGTVQTTGPGKALGIGPGYRAHFPGQIRTLLGASDGVLIAQQTASNLHLTVGDSVAILRVGLAPVTATVAGVVDLPNADSLFQAVGTPPGAAPQAPPDNVMLLPAPMWHQFFDPQAAARPDSVRTQLHVRLARDLPADPGAAFSVVQQRAHNLEARIAGSALIGDNLAARLGGVREDALYARVLFVFLGVPGAILAMLVTVAVAAAGADRRRQERALLRTRGASTAAILRLAGLEALVTGIGGVAVGLALAGMASGVITPGTLLVGDSTTVFSAGAALIGIGLALGAVLYPAWTQARRTTVVAGRATLGRVRQPLWQQAYLDLVLLAVSGLAFWQTASTGYQVVLAPEGVPQTAVSYQAFLAPVCLWLGGGLLALRLGQAILGRGRRAVATALRPLARGLAGVVAASLGRQRTRVVGGLVLVALAFAFAVSTATFNTTYNAQARVDAELTNGADVTVIGTTADPAGDQLASLRALPGVAGIAPMQHRFAYVGNDLQDLYGIDPSQLAGATDLSNAFFAGGNAAATLAALASRPDGVLVSQETVNDYQIMPGDLVNLRLQSASDHQYHVVPFHFVGVVREFPTAPHDSFLVANATYIAAQTGTPAAEIVLLRASGSPDTLAAQVLAALASRPSLRVSDLAAAGRLISSSLTAVDLAGLTGLELSFALLLLVAATGLVLALGLAERRRTFGILVALGARNDQLGAFLWSEGLLILIGGALLGLALGFGVAAMLVTVLTGVFDPPPDGLAVPWPYLGMLAAAALLATGAAVLGAERASVRGGIQALHDI
ncbi:MAG: FtsX-like permease family protein [Chloroflexia bacterium]